jgi:hypothetical protein
MVVPAIEQQAFSAELKVGVGQSTLTTVLDSFQPHYKNNLKANQQARVFRDQNCQVSRISLEDDR